MIYPQFDSARLVNLSETHLPIMNLHKSYIYQRLSLAVKSPEIHHFPMGETTGCLGRMTEVYGSSGQGLQFGGESVLAMFDPFSTTKNIPIHVDMTVYTYLHITYYV